VTPIVLFGLLAAALFALALYSLLTARHLLRKLIALNVMGTSVFLIFLTMAARARGVDAVPHAMVLTGIVVTVGATGMALALIRRAGADSGRASLPEDHEDGADRDDSPDRDDGEGGEP
jgi:multicomponent Na+:H+ antiporter subunit C